MPKRFKNIEKLRTKDGKNYYKNVIYPEIPETEDDFYVITTGEDRYDILAQEFYGDSSLWWVIASANNVNKDSIVVRQGIQLRIPASPVEAKLSFERVNKNL